MPEDKSITETDKNDTSLSIKKKKKGFISRVWNSVFRLHDDDFEKRLQNISKEEAAVLARMKKRSLTWRKMTRHLIFFSVIFEVIAVGYAIMTTRSMELDWKMRAFRILPMFLLPALSSLAYSAFVSFTRMCDRKDQKTLERLRAERLAKINELKEKTNYYTTQQLIQEIGANRITLFRRELCCSLEARLMLFQNFQFHLAELKTRYMQRYDPDPAAKAAAATVLASKLGADSGLKVYLGADEDKANLPIGKSRDAEFVERSGLRNRKQVRNRSSSAGSSPVHHFDEETIRSAQSEVLPIPEHNQLVVQHQDPQSYSVNDGGWISRLAALLVGEDPTQSYALICGNCHMHNGLARKEDFPYITYYCPHCQALNQPKQAESVSGSNLEALKPGGNVETVDDPTTTRPIPSDSILPSNNSSTVVDSENDELTEKLAQSTT